MAKEVTTTGAALNVLKNCKGNVVVSWTGGKDGCFACYNALLDGFNVTHLLSFKDVKRRRSHEIKPELLAAQSESMGIPIIHRDFVSYEEEFKRQVRNLNLKGAGIKGAVFGHIGMHENLVQRICSDLEIEEIMPLWNRDSEQIVMDVIDAGFEAIVVTANATVMGSEWLGRTIDKEFVSQLREFNSAIDVCGENGEFHTFVIDGPLFKNRIQIGDSERIFEDGYWRLEILDYAVGEEKRAKQ